MRGALGLIGLLLALLIVAFVAKQQLQATRMTAAQPFAAASGVASGSASGAGSNVGSITHAPQQVQVDLDRAAQEAAKRLEQAESAANPP